MLLSLSERTYLVTGGGSGIGKGVAAAVVASGGNAVLAGRNADKLAAAAEEIKAQTGDGAGEVIYEPADVTDEDQAARLVEAATAWHGRLDGVVHSAGGSETIGPIDLQMELARPVERLDLTNDERLGRHRKS